MTIADILFGRPLATEQSEGERVGPIAGVPILGLDALASAAYGPEALLTVLLPLGLAGARHLSGLTLVIIGLLVVVAISYRQTIEAYPNGGGAYTVAKENLGTTPSLFAAAALALDYLLNVAVAISAGVGALVSAVPGLLPYTLPLCLGILVILTLVNLRGVRATGLVFMLPTYLFVASLFAIIGVGVVKTLLHGGHPPPVVAPAVIPATVTTASIWLLVRAFASGCTAMTGVEAVSNGVPIFRKPSVVGARRALTLIVVILIVLLGGVALLCRAYGITATPPGQEGYQSVLSQLIAATIGRGPFYYVAIAAIVTVLSMSANTSFADFPRVLRMLAGDKFLPEPFVHRGRRLAFSYGILTLSVLSGALLIVFGGITEGLIPLFAVGALSAFTMSQIGMVAHWHKKQGVRAKRSLVLNVVGAAATGATLCVVLVSKFTHGAWIALVLVGAMIVLFRRVRAHYDFIARATATDASLAIGPPTPPIAVLPIRRWDAVTLKALSFAVGFAPEVVAVQVLTHDRHVDDLTDRWPALVTEPAQKLGIKAPRLVVLRSEFRQVLTPLLDFVTELAKENPDRLIAVIVPELVEARWYHYLLHNHTASVIKALLLFRGGPQVLIVNTPWHLSEWIPERRRLHRLRASSMGRWLAHRWTPGRRGAP
jgi:amino acid transporter